MNKNKELDIWVRGILATVMIFGTDTLFDHVKWFSKYSYTDEPLQLAEITDPLFWVLAISSMLVVGLCTYLDKWIEGTQWFINWDKRLRKYQYKSLLILRIATAVVLLFSWQLKTLAMPELAINNEWILWLEFLLAVLLIFRKTVPVAGAGMVVLYLFGIYKFGLFHMLDYFLLPGVAYYFITSNMTNDKIRNTGLLLLYITLGFSLCWAGMEKLVYPEWGTYILKEHPVLTLGLKPDLFIQGAAFIEISVGVMFILYVGILPSFFINLVDNDFLNYKNDANYGYAVFAKVIDGMDVVDEIAKVETGQNGPHRDWPKENVVIESIELIK